MDIKAHYRELGLDPGATHDEIVRSYRKQTLKLSPSDEREPADPTIDQRRLSVAESFLALNEVVSKPGQLTKATASRAHGAHWLESEVFRFQRTPICPTTIDILPARTPTLREHAPSRPPRSKAGETATPSPQGHFIVGSLVTLTVIVLLNLARDEHVALLPATAPPTSPVARTKRPTVVTAEPAKPEPLPISTGRLVVRTNRSKVNVEIRSQDASQKIAARRIDPTSHDFVGLAAGEYQIIAQLEGWAPISRILTVGPDKDVETLIEFNGGSLRLETDPSNAVVRDGDKILGRTPLLLPDLPPGNRTYSLYYEWWPENRITRTIREGTELKELVRFPRGRLSVTSAPEGAMVSIDGVEIGKTPLTIEQVPAGQRKLLLYADEYQQSEIAVNVSDGDDLKVHPRLASSLGLLDPDDIIASAWNDAQSGRRQYDVAPSFSGLSGTTAKNGIVRNLNRQRLDTQVLGRKFRYAATIRSYDAKSGQIEFAEQTGTKSKYRVLAHLNPDARANKAFTNRLLKGAMIELSAKVVAVEEPRWPAKTILFELDQAVPTN